jgi:hypothetical protein
MQITRGSLAAIARIGIKRRAPDADLLGRLSSHCVVEPQKLTKRSTTVSRSSIECDL